MSTPDFNFSIIEQDAAKTLLSCIAPMKNDDISNTILSYNGN